MAPEDMLMRVQDALVGCRRLVQAGIALGKLAHDEPPVFAGVGETAGEAGMPTAAGAGVGRPVGAPGAGAGAGLEIKGGVPVGGPVSGVGVGAWEAAAAGAGAGAAPAGAAVSPSALGGATGMASG